MLPLLGVFIIFLFYIIVMFRNLEPVLSEDVVLDLVPVNEFLGLVERVDLQQFITELADAFCQGLVPLKVPPFGTTVSSTFKERLTCRDVGETVFCCDFGEVESIDCHRLRF